MPIARVQLPDGRIGRFEVPEGTTPEQAMVMIQAQIPSLSQTAATEGTPTTQQEPGVWQKIRPYVAPTVEALGAAGGGLLGAGAGTMAAPGVGTAAGAVGGAGLGYGIAKEALELADVHFGGKPPRKGAAQVIEPVRNVLEGATYEAGGQSVAPILAKGVAAVAGKLADVRQIPKMKAAKVARASLGDDLYQAVSALRNAPPGTSVAEATSAIQNPTWQALVRDSLEKTPEGAKYLNNLAKMSQEEGVNALAKLAGGTTATDARGAVETAKQNLNAVTSPMREAALTRANLGKYIVDETVSREADDLVKAIASGGQIDPSRVAAQASGAEKALRSVGIAPLEGKPVAQKIASVLSNPKFAGNDLIEGSVKQIADDVAKWTDKGGVIDAHALDAIRKNSVNAVIAKLRPGMDATGQRNAAAGVLSRVKPVIDDAIESAGGKGWSEYLTTHSKGMQKIAEKQLTGEALTLWKTNKDAFVRLVQNESPETVEKILGPGKYNIAVEVTENTLNTLQSQANKHIAQMAASKQATEGERALATLLRENSYKFRLPSWLSFWGAATNKALGEMEKNIGSKTMKTLTSAMQSPKGAVNLLESLPTAERNHVLWVMANPSKWGAPGRAVATGAITTTTNALKNPEENQNALLE